MVYYACIIPSLDLLNFSNDNNPALMLLQLHIVLGMKRPFVVPELNQDVLY